MRKQMGQVRKHTGFTLIELVVVVMILGILAAVAAPKLLGTSSAATDNSLKQTLAVVRDAIERYAAENGGTLPGPDEATFKSGLADYLRGSFPICPVASKNAQVAMAANDAAFVVGGTQSWKYCVEDGRFMVNSSDPTATDSTVLYKDL